jgi:hypothetical protein
MRFDHIVVHIENNAKELQALKATLNSQGYPFEPALGPRSREFGTSNINIGQEYIEIVRIFKHNARSWMPAWAQAYDRGQRGAYCIFIEVEDVERTAVALKHAGIGATGPSFLRYPAFLGLLHFEAPYFIYYLPNFPGSGFQIALMQYKNENTRVMFQTGMTPNAVQNGINGIRRIEIALPQLADSLNMLQRIFPSLEQAKDVWAIQLEKTRILFNQSADNDTHIRLSTVTSQRSYAGNKFQINNVELVTIGG